MPQSFTALKYHFVFSTKGREPLIASAIQARLYEYLGGLCRARASVLLACGGTDNHLHLLVAMDKELSVAAFMRELKANASKWVHETFADAKDFGWQAGYRAFTVSQSNVDAVAKYISEQVEHHRKQTFKEEFIALLKKHDLPYDERYIWA